MKIPQAQSEPPTEVKDNSVDREIFVRITHYMRRLLDEYRAEKYGDHNIEKMSKIIELFNQLQEARCQISDFKF